MRPLIFLATALLITTFAASCKKDAVEKDVKEQNLNGKIAPLAYRIKEGNMEFYDLRDPDNPRKASFVAMGSADNFYLQYLSSRPIGANTSEKNYGDLSLNRNTEIFLADRNWPG